MTRPAGLDALKKEVEHRSSGFIGREQVLTYIDTWLDAAAPRILLLTGDMGIGKSAIAAHLINIALGDASAPPGVRRLGPGSVSAAHFCNARHGETLDPVLCARSLATQLALTVPGFADAFLQVAASLGNRSPQLNIHMTAGTVQTMTAVNTLTLHVGPIAARDAFSRWIVEPFKALPAAAERRLLIVDALDETLQGGSQSDSLIGMLAASDGLPPQVRLMITCRTGVAAVEGAFPWAQRLDLGRDATVAAEGYQNAELFVHTQLQHALTARGLIVPSDLADQAARLTTHARANFQYLRFAIDSIVAGQHSLDELQRLPRGFDGLYHDALMRIQAVSGRAREQYTLVLGLLAAAREPIPAIHLQGAAQLDTLTFGSIMRDLGPFVRTEPATDGDDTAYQFWHESMVEFVQRQRVSLTSPPSVFDPDPEPPGTVTEKTNEFFLPLARGHEWLGYWFRNGWYLGWSIPPGGAADRYAFRHMISHLAAATVNRPPVHHHRILSELAALITDRLFQDRHLARLADPAQLIADARLVLTTATQASYPDAPIQIIRLAEDLRRLRKRLGDPEIVFEQARSYPLPDVQRTLDLYPLDPVWRCITLSILALAAAHPAPASARSLCTSAEQLAHDLGMTDETPGLLVRAVRAALDDQPNPLPPSAYPFSAPSYEVAREIVIAYGTGRITNISGLPPSDEQPVYAAQQHAPLLVGYALSDPVSGLNLLLEYIRILAANPYAVYRNRGLYILLEYVIYHPDWALIRNATREIVSAVLSGDDRDLREMLPLAAMGALARAGGPARQSFAEVIAETQAKAQTLLPNRNGDSWSGHLRRFAALAEIDAFTQVADAPTLFAQARSLPLGYAGYRAPACFTLAETARLVFGPGTPDIALSLTEARQAAHNIQDSDFCLITTARVNALEYYWWLRPLPNAIDTALTLHDSLDRPEIAALHIVGEAFREREGGRVIEDIILQARTLADLADIYRCRTADLQRLNPTLPPAPLLLNAGERVAIPDPGLLPLIATRLAAEIVTLPPTSVRIIALQALVVPAAADPTTLDTVLARLLLAAVPAVLDSAWTGLLTDLADELPERQQATDSRDFAYEFLP